MSLGYDVPLIDRHQLEQGHEGREEVVEVVAAISVDGKIGFLEIK